MEFFDKISKKASEAYKATADKTGKLAKETKLKLKMNELKTQVHELYEEIGKKVYEKHVREEDISIKKDLEEECTKIDVLSDEIENLLKQCLDLKDRKQCPKCYVEIEKDMNFCYNCGQKQTEEPAREIEIIQDLENSEVEEDNKQEEKIVKEELLEDLSANKEQQKEDNNKDFSEEEQSNLEKTVAIESNVNVEDE